VDFRAYLRAEGWLAEDTEQSMEQSVSAEVQRAVEAAEAAPLEPVEELTRDVYTPRAS